MKIHILLLVVPIFPMVLVERNYLKIKTFGVEFGDRFPHSVD